MKINLLPLFAAAVIAVTACQSKTANDKTKDSGAKDTTVAKEEAAPMDPGAIQKAYMDYCTPGNMHTMLASQDGEWNTQTISFMNPAGPDTSMGMSVNKMILNGLYQESTYSGDMGGMPFMGKGTTGYDNLKKVFMTSWVDNMGSGIMMFEGPYDEATKTMTLTAKYTDPVSKKEETWKQVNKMVDENTCTMEMYKVEGDKETKIMEQKSTRKGNAPKGANPKKAG